MPKETPDYFSGISIKSLGETQRSMKPMEYFNLATKVGLSTEQTKAALRQLKDDLLIRFHPETTEIIVLTQKGVQEAEYLKLRDEHPRLNDPIPESLDDVRAELGYFSQERQKQHAKSQEFAMISARITELQHREMMLRESTSASIHNQSTTQHTPANATSVVRASNLAVFISHSSKDEALARAVVELLRSAMNLSSKDIRCSSVNGYRLPVGAHTETTLREEVNSAAVMVGLVTPNSLASAYVMFELGARWGVSSFLAPLLASVSSQNLRCTVKTSKCSSSFRRLSTSSICQRHIRSFGKTGRERCVLSARD
jgi:hypothetical protein